MMSAACKQLEKKFCVKILKPSTYNAGTQKMQPHSKEEVPLYYCIPSSTT